MNTNREWERDIILSKFNDRVDQLNKDYYNQFKDDEGHYVDLQVGQDVFSYRKMFVPFNDYTHMAHVLGKDGYRWSYARELTAEEKENAPEGCDWIVDNCYTKCVGNGFCYG